MQQRQPHTHATCGFCLQPKIIRSKPHETKIGQPIYPECLDDWNKTIGGVGLTVTHYDSGKRVCEVPHHTVAACCNDTKAAAKMALDKLIEKAGPERVRSVLSGA